MRKSAFRTPFLIIAILGGLALVSLRCVEAPDAPVRDNPFQGDPFELSATLASEGVVLTWKAVGVSGLTGYKVYRSMRADSGFASKGTVSEDSLHFTDGDIYSDSTYYYRVAALLGSSESGTSGTYSITITDAALCVSDSIWNAPGAEATSPTFSITNCSNSGRFAWTASVDRGWQSLSDTSGNTPDGFTIAADANRTGSTRSGTVRVIASGVGDSTKSVVVTQPSVAPRLCVSQASWEAPLSGGISEDLVVTNCGNNTSFAWSAVSNDAWLTISPTAGNVPGVFSITAEANSTESSRTGSVTVTASGIDGSPQAVTATQSSLFSTAGSYGVGNHPSSVFSIDLNGDGNNDLVTTNRNSHDVSILLGNGDGTFQSAVSYGVGISPNSVFSIDFNNDGKNDLATANRGADNVSILLGNGDGSFQSVFNYPAGEEPCSVFSIDLNGDDNNDLAIANFISDGVSVLLGNGDGTFRSAVNYNVGDLPFSVFSIDFDGDGDNDLATANYGSPNVSIMLCNGDGTFQNSVDYPVEGHAMSVFAVDLNGDGNNDLATVSSFLNGVSILLGNGNGTFQSAVNYAAGDGSFSVFSIDFDGDGDNDLATANNYSRNVSILLGNGDGTFQSAVDFAVGDSPSSVFSVDLDGDGDNDVAVANGGSHNVSILINNTQ